MLSPALRQGQVLFPGMLSAATIGLAAAFLAEHYGGSTMLYALLLGMAFHFLAREGQCAEGIAFSARTVLRAGVALLGFRISWQQVQSLGSLPLLQVAAAMALTIFGGIWLARRLGLSSRVGVLTGCAVAICGASAALAVAAVLPRDADSERETLFTVLGVTALSTLAMIAYPLLVTLAGLDARAAGIVLGGTIHDVAQVVAAGYSLSQPSGDTATLVKLVRVAMLVPITVLVAVAWRQPGQARAGMPAVPGFLLAFVAAMAINSLITLPAALRLSLEHASRACLVTAIAALGMKTSLEHLVRMGARPVLLLVGETLLLAAIVFGTQWLPV